MSFCSEVIENYKKCKYGNELVPLFFLFYEIKKKSRVLRNTRNCMHQLHLSVLSIATFRRSKILKIINNSNCYRRYCNGSKFQQSVCLLDIAFRFSTLASDQRSSVTQGPHRTVIRVTVNSRHTDL